MSGGSSSASVASALGGAGSAASGSGSGGVLPVMRARPEYWQVLEGGEFADLEWNIPEREQGRVAIVGGQKEAFALPIKVAEYASGAFPFRAVTTVLPDAVAGVLPKLPGVELVGSTKSGGFRDGERLGEIVQTQDFTLMVGDVGRKSESAEAIIAAIARVVPSEGGPQREFSSENFDGGGEGDRTRAKSPIILTRDVIDLVAEGAGRWLPGGSGLTLVATLPQLKKIFAALYYPKMLTLTMPLAQLVEVLHKFTLSYPATIVSFHDGQMVIASGGEVATMVIKKTPYSPLTLWQGELAVKVMAFMLFNPGQKIAAVGAALQYKG